MTNTRDYGWTEKTNVAIVSKFQLRDYIRLVMENKGYYCTRSETFMPSNDFDIELFYSSFVQNSVIIDGTLYCGRILRW